MSILYGGLHVDEKYSSILEPNLYYNSVFADGKTFTSKYEAMPGGGVAVHKLDTTACAPGTPGRDFSDELTTDTLIPIVLNNNFQKSKKIYGVQASAVDVALANEQLGIAVQEVGEGIMESGLACLVAEAGTTASSTATLTTANIKSNVLADRKAIVNAKGKADVLLMSPNAYAILLEKFGDEMTPVANDFTNASGQIAKWLGFDVYECNGLAQSTASYYDSTGSAVTETLSSVDYIMYNHEALSIINNFDVARIIDSENFAGSKAQVEDNVGFKVTSPAQVVARTH